MVDAKLKAICEAIIKGYWNTSELTLGEFEAIHEAVAIAKRQLAIELVSSVRQEFKQQVEALATRIP